MRKLSRCGTPCSRWHNSLASQKLSAASARPRSCVSLAISVRHPCQRIGRAGIVLTHYLSHRYSSRVGEGSMLALQITELHEMALLSQTHGDKQPHAS